MENIENKKSGKLALGLCLGGLLIFAFLLLAINIFKPTSSFQLILTSYIVFISFQISAFVLGLLSKHDKFGKAAYITSSILALGSFALM